MSIELVRELWDYHHWANRRLFDIAAGLGEEIAGREVGRQFSVPTLRGMFVHVFSSDRWWLGQWTEGPGANVSPDDDASIVTLGALRHAWDELVSEQQRFVAGLGEADLVRVVDIKSPLDGRLGSRRLGLLLLHVPNHATHHRSEIATMLTMISGSPPDTGINSYHRAKAGR